jgi:hypothetical protein
MMSTLQDVSESLRAIMVVDRKRQGIPARMETILQIIFRNAQISCRQNSKAAFIPAHKGQAA